MIGAHNRDNDFRFLRERPDRRYIPLEQSSPLRSYMTEILRLGGIVLAGCLLLVALLAVQP